MLCSTIWVGWVKARGHNSRFFLKITEIKRGIYRNYEEPLLQKYYFFDNNFSSQLFYVGYNHAVIFFSQYLSACYYYFNLSASINIDVMIITLIRDYPIFAQITYVYCKHCHFVCLIIYY